MPVDHLSEVVALLAALSVASERLVEIVKGGLGILEKPPLEPPDTELSAQERRAAAVEAARKESRRQAGVQLLAAVCGIITTILAWPMVGEIFSQVSGIGNHTFLALAVGILASGGSGFWNSIQSYLLAVKDIKKVEAKERKAAAQP